MKSYEDITPGEALRSELGLRLPDEVAECFGVTVETLAQWRAKAIGPIPTRLGKSVYYHIDDLREWSKPVKTVRQPTVREIGRTTLESLLTGSQQSAPETAPAQTL